MKFLVVLAVAVACAAADVSHIVSGEASAPVVKSTYESSPEGSFQYLYETGNGIYAQANGVVKPIPNTNDAALQVQGSYKYTAPDGTPVETQWVSDEFGYRATGSHIPVAPEIPELIQRSLAYIAAHPPPVEKVNKPY